MTIDFDAINSKIDILELLGLQGTKAAATTNGGEWKTACPVCGGRDRFSVWANHPSGACGWCRQCNRSFDALDLYQAVKNLDRKSAIQELQNGSALPIDAQSSRSSEKIDLDRWNSKAFELCEQWHKDLYNNESVFQWLIDRGISDHSIIANNIGFNDHDHYMSGSEWGMTNKDKVFIPRGITIPNPGHYVNIRRSVPSKAKDKYWKIAGSRGFIFVAGGSFNHTIGYLFESELDAILASQSGFDAAYFSLPAGQSLTGNSSYLKDITDLIICMDWDEPGQEAAKKHLIYNGTIESDPLPGGAKDLGAYYTRSSMNQVTEWLLDQAEKIEGKAWT